TALRFPAIFLGLQTIYYCMSSNPAFDRKLFSWMDTLRSKSRGDYPLPQRFIDLRILLDEMRLIKTPEEREVIKRACEISSIGHIETMSRAQVGMFEYTLEAILFHEFCRKGARHLAYPSIVAAGENACTLHYTKNNARIKDKELVLIDAGAENE